MSQIALDFAPCLPGQAEAKHPKIIETLPVKIHRNDTDYVQVRRGKNAVIYEESFENRVHGYIVFEIRVQQERKVFDNVVPTKEKWPSDEDFGSTAWCLGPNLNRAIERFYQLEGGEYATA